MAKIIYFLVLIAVMVNICYSKDAACDLPIVVGPCRAKMPAYAFDSTTNKCEKFNYGGCRGNDNKFSTLIQCQEACEQ